MLNYIKGDLLSVTDGYIIHGCNCSGGFGSGIAGQIKIKWPKVRLEFLKMPANKESLGKIQVIPITEALSVINCFTQLTYGYKGVHAIPVAIAKSLKNVYDLANQNKRTIHSPKIGCGLGGLSWEDDVLPIFEYYQDEYPDVNTIIYEL